MRVPKSRCLSCPVMLLCALIATGCASSTSSHTVRTVCRANLDDCYQIQLVHRSSKQREGWGPQEYSEQAVVVIAPRAAIDEYSLRRVPASGWPSWSMLEFGDVEARCDASRQRIWFVDRATGQVIGSVDRPNRQTTGPGDQHPAWATAEGGERLE